MQITDFEADLTRLLQAEGRSLADAKKAQRDQDLIAFRRAQQLMVDYHLQVRELVKAEVRKFNAELRLKAADDDDKKVAQLLKAFATGTRLQRIFRDILSERPHSNRCARAVFHRVLKVLDDLGRTNELAVFLDHPYLAVRASAASSLRKTMPDRCLPIINEIAELGRWVEAGSIACDAQMFDSVESPEKAQV